MSHPVGGEPTVTAFKQAQVKHRRRGDNPNKSDDLGECIDFLKGNDERIIPLQLPASADGSDVYRGPLFGVVGFPGFMYAPQAIDSECQLELAYRSVKEYCEAPHRTNIDLCQPKPNEILNKESSMWGLFRDELSSSNTSASKKPKLGAPKPKMYRSFDKLSWACMGYHYDWTQRTYHDACQSEMPSLVGDLAVHFARTCLYVNGQSNVSFTPSASIVNYYSLKSLMGGHQDDLEFTMEKPIVSFSCGLPAVFLLGGKTKEDSPVLPILVRPGDVMCMGGDSRINYHGMARVIPLGVLPPAEGPKLPEKMVNLASMGHEPSQIGDEEGEALQQFLSSHRINVNIRQVYPDNEETP